MGSVPKKNQASTTSLPASFEITADRSSRPRPPSKPDRSFGRSSMRSISGPASSPLGSSGRPVLERLGVAGAPLPSPCVQHSPFRGFASPRPASWESDSFPLLLRRHRKSSSRMFHSRLPHPHHLLRFEISYVAYYTFWPAQVQNNRESVLQART